MAGETRSPNYPALSVQQAVGLAQRLWEAEKRSPISNDAAVVAMGFKGLSGPARVAIGALRQYGLIEKAEKGLLRVSELATRIFLGDPSERASAIAEAALKPELFQELMQAHADASENSIRLLLSTKKGFHDDGARKAAKSFRETLQAVKLSDSGYNGDETARQGQNMQGKDVVQDAKVGATAEDGVLSLNVPSSNGTIAVQIRVSGQPINAQHLARVRRYLQLAEEDLAPMPSKGE